MHQVNIHKTGYFSQLILDYLSHKKELQDLYRYSIHIDSFEKIIQDKESINRKILVQVLKEQYSKRLFSEQVNNNIHALSDNSTFTITTAHQPCLFTGPLYFLYKIISTIKLSQQLKEQYPSYHFVPIFWIGSEDHDFEEINHAYVNGKKISWETDQTGAVGRMLLRSIEPVVDDLKNTLGTQWYTHELTELVSQFYRPDNTLAEATTLMVNHLFGEYGLVVLDGDSTDLKQSFQRIIEKDVFEQNSNQLVNQTIDNHFNSYKTQAHPRAINFFYLQKGIRSRIVQKGEKYEVLDTPISFSKDTLLQEIKNHPERFSPNVIMRPLYQEFVLPNLAYIGGGGESSYWLQLRSTFDHYAINYPLVLLRDSALLTDSKTLDKWEKIGFSVEELFKNGEFLKKQWLTNQHLLEDLSNAKEQLNQLLKPIIGKAKSVDSTLEPMALAAQKRMQTSLDTIEKKINRAIKRKEEYKLSQVDEVKEHLFPLGGLQERKVNGLSYLIQHPDLIDQLLHAFDPLKGQFKIISLP